MGRASPVEVTLLKSVVLVGMMGSGKTAVGTAMARALQVPFLDSDHEIEKAANMSIAEIFERDGEAFFRDRETEVLSRLLDRAPAILSTGGGAFLAARNRDLISAKGAAIWLKADLELLWSRVAHKDTRPLLRTADPKATLAGLCAEREPIYQLADIHVEADASYSIETMADKVIQAVAAFPELVKEDA